MGKMKASALVTLLLMFVGLIVLILIAVSTATHTTEPKQVHLHIAAMILLVFMGGVAIVNHFMGKAIASNYNVNAVEKGGNENRAYEIEAERKVNQTAPESNDKTAEDKSKQTAENEQKWVSNYVPYGDYPKGNIVYVKEDEVM